MATLESSGNVSLTNRRRQWPQITVRTSVRVSGIGAPEIRGKCDSGGQFAEPAVFQATAVKGRCVGENLYKF